jgi:hypothetical protein
MSETYSTAAEAHAANPGPASPATDPVLYIREGAVIPASETVTAEEGARDLTAYRDAGANSAARSISADFANAIDQLRASPRPTIQDFDPTVKTAPPPEPVQLEQPVAPASAVETALAIPEVREAIETELNATAQTRQAYSAGLQNAQAFAQAALMEIVPELANFPLEHFHGAMAQLAQVDPRRHGAVVRLLDNVLRVQAAKLAEEAHAAQGRAAWAKAEDAKFTAAVGPVSSEVTAEMISYAGELGIPKQQLVHLLRTEPVLQSAAFQHVILTAVTARLAQKKAANWRSRAAPKALPTVVKPGTSQPRISAAAADLNALSNNLSRSGSLRDAAALLVASRKSRS